MLSQDVLRASVVPALLCVVVLSAQVVVFVAAAGIVAHCPGNSLLGHCCTTWHHSLCLGNTIVPCYLVVARMLCPTSCRLLSCSLWPSDWLATSVAYWHWVLSFTLVVGSFARSLSFVCSFHGLPHLFSFCLAFYLAIALVVAIFSSFSSSFISFSFWLTIVSFVSFASSSFSFICC